MKKTYIALLTICTALFFVSCETTKEIPEEATAAQIIQKGQSAYDSSKYKDAEFYYKAVIERFSTETDVYVEAKYELGHIYMKTKKYDQAKACFEEILDIYRADPYGALPGAYKKLALLELAKIPE